MKNTWKGIKNITLNNFSSDVPRTFSVNDVTNSNPCNTANTFNNYFTYFKQKQKKQRKTSITLINTILII